MNQTLSQMIVSFVYNSERIEGNALTELQATELYTSLIHEDAMPSTNDERDMCNHFAMFEYMTKTVKEPLTTSLIKSYHRCLKKGTDEAGKWKTFPNAVGSLVTTTPPKYVQLEIDKLLAAYSGISRPVTMQDISNFHALFERIHPFQDGNGRVGRIIMLKECVKHGLQPFIVLDSHKNAYYRALSNFEQNPSELCSFCEDMVSLMRA